MKAKPSQESCQFSPPLFLEILEARIAPASLSGDGKTVTFTDTDGDQVTVKTNTPIPAGTNVSDVFKFNGNFGDTGAQTLDTIDLTAFGLTAETAKKFTLEVKTKKVDGGDGATNIGDIVATGLDLKKIKVSGGIKSIVAGDADTTTQAVGVIEAGSLGGDGSGTTTLAGGVDVVKIRGDVTGHVDITATGGKNSAEKIEIGGKLLGGTAANTGTLTLGGSIKVLKIAGGIEGGDGASSGALVVNGNVSQSLELGGIRGGVGTSSGGATVTGDVGVGSFGDLQGGTGSDSGFTNIGGHLKKGSAGNISGDAMGSGAFTVGSFGTVKIEGITGGDSADSGVFSASGGGKSFTVTGDITGGDGQSSGTVVTGAPVGGFFFGNLNGGAGKFSGGVTVAAGDFNGDGKDDVLTAKGGNIAGGTGEASGVFTSAAGTKSFTANNIIGNGAKNGGGVFVAAGDINGDGTTDLISSVKVNNIAGGTAQGSGFIVSDGTNLFACNNIFGGTATDSGVVKVNGDVTKFALALDLQALQGGTGAGAIIINGDAASVQVNGARGGDLFVHGNLTKFTNKFGVYQGSSDGFDMFIDENLGSAIFGGPVFNGQIFAGGSPPDPNGGIGLVQVNGNVSGLDVFAGFTNPSTPVNENASITKVSVSGSMSNCRLWAGVEDHAGSDNIPDRFIGGALDSTARIAEIVSKGPLTNCSFFAPEITKVNFPGSPSLAAGPGNDTLTNSGVFIISEIPAPP